MFAPVAAGVARAPAGATELHWPQKRESHQMSTGPSQPMDQTDSEAPFATPFPMFQATRPAQNWYRPATLNRYSSPAIPAQGGQSSSSGSFVTNDKTSASHRS